MRKQLLKERFQQLAGIKPLYEQDNSSSTGDMKVKYEIIQKAEDITKEEAKEEFMELSTKLESKKGEIMQHLQDEYDPTEIAKFLISAPKEIGTVINGGLGHATDSKIKIKILKYILGFAGSAFAVAGYRVENFNPEIVAKTIPGESKNWFEKLRTWDWEEGASFPPETFHQEIYGDGTNYYVMAAVLLMYVIILNFKESRMKEDIEGTDGILKSIMAMIDADTDMIIKTLEKN